MRIARYFREMDPAYVLTKVALRWNLTTPLPVPRFPLRCSLCHSKDVLISQYRFHTREDSPTVYRADVQCKCTVCSLAFVHGVVVPETMYRAIGGPRQLNRRAAAALLREAGVLPEA